MTTAETTYMGFAPAPHGLCELVWAGPSACRCEAQESWPLVRRMCNVHAVRFLDPVFRGCGCGPTPCPACRRHIDSGLRVLVVGERENGPRHQSRALDDEGFARRLRESLALPEMLGGQDGQPPVDRSDYVLRQFQRHHRAFSWGNSRKRLVDLGLRWDMAMNLLGPSPKVGEWDAAVAREIADGLKPFLGSYRVVLLGQRVAEAFGADLPLLPVGPFYRLPHPSGRNRVWNGTANVEAARTVVDGLYGARIA